MDCMWTIGRWAGGLAAQVQSGACEMKIAISRKELDACIERHMQVLVTLIRDAGTPPADPGILTIIQKIAALQKLVPAVTEATEAVNVGWNEKTGADVYHKARG